MKAIFWVVNESLIEEVTRKRSGIVRMKTDLQYPGERMFLVETIVKDSNVGTSFVATGT